jgi:hypothetical protein
MLGGPLIYMMQTTKNRPRNDIRSILNLHLSRRCKGSNLSDGTMRTPSIEVANILIQDPAQMAFIEYEAVVEALGPHRSHPALGDRVGLGRFEWRPDLRDAKPIHSLVECGSETAVSVMDEKTRRITIPTTGFDDLLRHPFGCWMVGNLDMHDLAAGVMDHKENIESLKTDRLDTEEVAGPDISGMSLEKDSPSRRPQAVIGSAHVLCHSSG